MIPNSKEYGPLLPLSQEIDAIKYRQTGENFYSKCVRIADALKDDDHHFDAFKRILRDQRFLPAGRVQNAMGSTRQTTAYNCFVSETIEDSMDSIMMRATEAAETMRRGGGIGVAGDEWTPYTGPTVDEIISREIAKLAVGDEPAENDAPAPAMLLQTAQEFADLILESIQGPCKGNQNHFAQGTMLLESMNKAMRLTAGEPDAAPPACLQIADKRQDSQRHHLHDVHYVEESPAWRGYTAVQRSTLRALLASRGIEPAPGKAEGRGAQSSRGDGEAPAAGEIVISNEKAYREQKRLGLGLGLGLA